MSDFLYRGPISEWKSFQPHKFCILGSVHKYFSGGGAGQNGRGEKVLSYQKGGGNQKVFLSKGGGQKSLVKLKV